LYFVVALLAFAVADPPAQITLVGTCRDFTPSTSPDFESFCCGVQTGMVQSTLSSIGKPVLSSNHPFITSSTTFDQWYQDVPGVNIPFIVPVTLDRVGTSNIYSHYDGAFFPLDGRGYGDYSAGHNFHFTCEFKNTFTYQGGETFDYIGDDDVWVFINGKLAIDIGGVHGAAPGSVDLDASAAYLGLVPGRNYDLTIFQAERHTSASTLQIETSIVLEPAFPNPSTPKQYCSLVNPADFTYGQGYYCYNGGFVQCYSGSSAYQPCPLGTSCQCSVGIECSDHGTRSPCA